MNSTGKIAIAGGVLIGAAVLIPKAIQAKEAYDISNAAAFRIKSFKFKQSKPAGGNLLDKLLALNFDFQAVLETSNPTDKSMELDQPYIDAAYNNNPVGNSDPSTRKIKIAPQQKTDIPVNVTIYGSKAIGSAADLLVYFGKRIAGIAATPRPITLNVSTAANGFPVSKKFNVNL